MKHNYQAIFERAEKDFKPHFIEDLGAEAYHSQKQLLSSTGLREALRSPKHFIHKHLEEEPYKPNDDLVLGTLAHTAIELAARSGNPKEFFKEAVVKPKFDLRTKAGKADNAAWIEEHEGFTILSEPHAEAIEGWLDTISQEKSHLFNMLKSGKQELSGFGYDEETRLKLRTRCDSMLVEEGMIFDYKTTTDASYDAFMYSIRKYRMHMQAALYLKVASQVLGRPVEMFRWVALEKKAPYDVAIWDADPAYLEMGEQDLRRALKIIDHCDKTGNWCGYQSELSAFISPPLWEINKYAEMMEDAG